MTKIFIIVKKRLEEVFKFSIVGIVKTFGGLGLNFIFLKYFKTPLILTYTCVYLFMILISYYLTKFFVFKKRLNSKGLFLYFLIYISSWGLGVGLLSLIRDQIVLENWIYPFLVIPFTLTFNYILVYLLFSKNGEN